jgi:hypothetical protein
MKWLALIAGAAGASGTADVDCRLGASRRSETERVHSIERFLMRNPDNDRDAECCLPLKLAPLWLEAEL